MDRSKHFARWNSRPVKFLPFLWQLGRKKASLAEKKEEVHWRSQSSLQILLQIPEVKLPFLSGAKVHLKTLGLYLSTRNSPDHGLTSCPAQNLQRQPPPWCCGCRSPASTKLASGLCEGCFLAICIKHIVLIWYTFMNGNTLRLYLK